MEIKRVIAGGLATLAAGATMVLGAGAVTLGDFVQVTGNTMTSPYIVIGDNAKAEDTLAGADIAVALAGQATQTVSVAGAQATMAVSDGALIETKSDKLYFGEAFNTTGTSFRFTNNELPVLLNTETFTQDDGDDVEVTQRLYAFGQSVAFGNAESDWEEPELYVEFTDGEPVFKYEVRFTPALEWGEIEDEEISLLGKSFVFGEEADQAANKLTLFESSETKSIAAGESLTVTVDGTDYVITVVGISEGASASDNTATIDINGESDSYGVGDDIEEGDLEAHVKTINAFKFPVESGSVELFIGSSSTVLEDGEKVTLGGEEVDDAIVDFTNTTTISKFTVTFFTDDDIVLKVGEDFTEPVFGGAFDVAFGGMAVDLDSASKDLVTFAANDDDLELTFTNLDGNEYDFVVAHASAATTLSSTDGSDNMVNFANNATLSPDEFVVVTDVSEEYTYVLEFTDVDSDDRAILEDVSTGTEYKYSAGEGTIGVGSIDVEVLGYNADAELLVLNNTAGAKGTIAKIVTYSGAYFYPDINASTASTTGEPPQTYFSKVFFAKEEADGTFDADSDVTVDSFNVTVTVADTAISAVNLAGLNAGSLADNDEGDHEYGVSEAGTYVVRYSESGDEDWVKLYIPDDPIPVAVAFGADPAFSAGEGASAGTVEQAVQIKNSISKMESEVTADASLGRDLVLLGGPCANGLVAELLEMSETNPECATEFTALYPTEGVITVVEDAWSSGQKALVVAGVDRAATRNLAVKVMQGTLDYSA